MTYYLRFTICVAKNSTVMLKHTFQLVCEGCVLFVSADLHVPLRSQQHPKCYPAIRLLYPPFFNKLCSTWNSTNKKSNRVMSGEFYVLLTVQPGMILVNNQLDAQFFIYVFMYVYFYSLHVSGNHLLIIRRIIVSMRQLVYVTVYR